VPDDITSSRHALTYTAARQAARLPRVTAIGDDESWRSWIERSAAAYPVPVGAFLTTLRVPGWDYSTAGVSTGWGVALDDDTIRCVAFSTGFDQAAVRQMLLTSLHGPVDWSGFDPANPRTLQAVASREPFQVKASNLCPFCLAGSDGTEGVWQLRWHLRSYVACPQHRVMLIQDCPACAVPLRVGRSGRRIPAAPNKVPAPANCSNLVLPVDGLVGSRRRTRCGHDLTAVAAEAVPAGDPLLTDQQAWLDRYQAFRSGHWADDLAPLDWFSAVSALVCLSVYALEPGDLATAVPSVLDRFAEHCSQRAARRPDGTVAWSHVPSDTRLAAAGMSYAVAVVTAPADDRTEKLALLAERTSRRVRDRNSGYDSVRTGWRLPAALSPSWRAALADHQPSFSARIAWDHDDRRYSHLTIDHIPAVCPTLEPFVGLIPGTSDQYRAIWLSLCLTRILNPTWTWAACNQALGNSPELVGCADFVTKKVRRAGHDTAVLSACRELLDAWDAAAARGDHPNYGHARRSLTTFTISPAEWTTIRASAGRVATQGGHRREAAGWAWADATGSHGYQSPPLLAAEQAGVPRDSLRELYRRFVNQTLTRDLRGALRAHVLRCLTPDHPAV